jgi:hypothetical protein
MRRLGIGVAICVLIGTAAAAIGSAAGSFVPTLTGCHNAKTGIVYAVAVGDQPLTRCLEGDLAVAFSSGDITKISAGTGLAGGGDNGDVTLSLAPGYALPQSCTSGQVAKWSGSAWQCAADQAGGTAYSAGDGLELVGNEFRLKGCANGQTPRYTIPGGWTCVNVTLASQTCSPGQFTQGVTAGGLLSCASPTNGGAAQAYFGKEVNPTQGGAEQDSVGIPDDNTERVYAFAVVPPGQYLVTAKARIGSTHDVDTSFVSPFGDLTCRLNDYADQLVYSKDLLNEDAFEGTFTLMGTVTSQGGALSLICAAGDKMDGLSISQARISAIKIG